MGSKYSSVSVSGYNSSPPSDDGTVSASNQVTWAGIKTKLADCLNTAVAAINTALVTALNQSVVAVTVSTNTDATHHNKTIEIGSTATSGVTISLGDAATMAAGYIVNVCNRSVHAQTIGRVTIGDTINGVAGNLTLPASASIGLVVNSGANGYNVKDSGGPEETTSSTVSATSFPSSGTIGDLTNISLTAGTWDISVNALALANGATVVSWTMGVSATSGNSSSGLVSGDTAASGAPPTSSYNSSACLSGVRVSPTATTTYYFKYTSSYSVATPQLAGRITARRVK